MILGRGSFTESFPLFGYSLDDYNVLFEEKLAIFAALRDADRTGQPVRWKGTMRPPLEGVRVYPPVEHPPLSTWVGVGGSPESVVRAARYGFPLTLAIIGGDPRRFKPYVELYHRALAQLGHDRSRRHPLAGAHRRNRRPGARGAVAGLPGHAESDRCRAGMGPDQPGRVRQEIAEGSLYVGSPETVARKIAATVRALGASRFDLKYSAGTLSHELMLRSIELYGREVIPRVRELVQAGRRTRGVRARGRIETRGVSDGFLKIAGCPIVIYNSFTIRSPTK